MGEPLTDAAFAAVYERHCRALLRYATRRVGEAQARDVVAETFMVAWRRRAELPTEDQLPWLYRTTGNVIANEHRKQVRAADLRGKLELRLVADDNDRAREPSADRLAWTLSAMQGLSEGDQEVLRLHAWEGLDGQDGGHAPPGSMPGPAPGSPTPSTTAAYAATDQSRNETS